MGGATHHRRRAQVFLHISIHAPRMGARLDAPAFGNFHWTFQSTRPAWGRDQCFIRSSEIFGHFNPRAPHGGATSVLLIVVQLHVFQSTRPAWGRDVHPAHLRHLLRISIHAPRMGARHGRTWISHGMVQFQSTRPAWGRDPRSGLRLQAVPYFNPRAPHGGATDTEAITRRMALISIHAPRMGARRARSDWHWYTRGFQSTRPAWGRDQACLTVQIPTVNFNPRAPHGGATSLIYRQGRC